MKKLVYDVPLYHGTLYEKVWRSSLDLENAITEISKRYPEISAFSEEVFSRLYADNKNKVHDVPYWYRWAEDLHSCLDDIDLRTVINHVNRDPIKAIAATSEVMKKLEKNLPKTTLEDIQEKEKEIEALEDLQAISNNSKLNKLHAKAENRLKVARDKAGRIEIDQDKVRLALRKSIDEFIEHDNAVSVIGNAPGTLAERLKHDASRTYLRAAKRAVYDKDFKRFLALCGNLQNAYQTEKRNMEVYTRTETSEITVGDDFCRAIMSEHMDDDLFDLKFINNELLVRDVKTRMNLNKGDVVMCIDFSGSMGSYDRHTIAKAIAFAMYTELKKECRKFHACLFNANVIYTFSHDRGDIMEFVEFMPDGGTVISSALEWATSIAKPKDDVIILSDGEVYLAENEIQMYRSQLPGSSILGVLIGYANDRVMTRLCDKMIATNDLFGTANDLFRFVQ
jgi:uncharacterized protein with von Willebrand factor type A (vWA) domain